MRSIGVFRSGAPGKRWLLAGVEVNAALLDSKTPQELENRRKTCWSGKKKVEMHNFAGELHRFRYFLHRLC